MTIKSFDRPTVKFIRDGINKALEAFAEEYGLVIHAGNISFTNNKLTVKVEVLTTDTNGKKFDVNADAFTRNADLYGLRPDHLGVCFMSNGSEFEITGLRLKNRKFPILAKKCSNGKSFKFRQADVQRALGLGAG